MVIDRSLSPGMAAAAAVDFCSLDFVGEVMSNLRAADFGDEGGEWEGDAGAEADTLDEGVAPSQFHISTRIMRWI